MSLRLRLIERFTGADCRFSKCVSLGELNCTDAGLFVCNLDELLAEIFPGEAAPQSVRGILKPLDHIYLVLDLPLTSPTGERTDRLDRSLEVIKDQEVAPLGTDVGPRLVPFDWAVLGRDR